MVLSGEAKKLKEIKLNFHHFTNAMHNPEENIYQQLDVDIPDEAVVKSHASGIYDDRFITFQLPKMVMEAQQSSLVCPLSAHHHATDCLIFMNGKR